MLATAVEKRLKTPLLGLLKQVCFRVLWLLVAEQPAAIELQERWNLERAALS